MPSCFYTKIESALYAERISAYRKDGVDDLTTLARYALNMALSESLYTSLQFAEIALRNSIHSVLTRRDQSEEWYDAASYLIPWQEAKVVEAKNGLKQKGKAVTAGRVVAELSFGFWTAFFNRAYDRNGVGHYIASHAFPHAPKPERSLRSLGRRWTDIRNLRNRVFHHERIIHWGDLPQRHTAILQVIGWMEPELEILTREIDRFQDLHRDDIGPWHAKVCTRWGT